MQPSLIRQANRDVRSLFLIVLAVLVLSWVEGVTFGQTELKPGPHDPVGKPSRYTIFRDDELLTYVPGSSQADFFTYDVNGSLSPTQIGDVTTGYSSASNQLAAAAGRIVSSDRDQVASIRRSADGTGIQLELVGVPGSLVSLPNLAPRVLGSADFMDVAVSDLDKVASATGYNHDEVVVAWASPGLNNQLAVNVAVLDYTGRSYSSPTPVATTTVTLAHPINANSFVNQFVSRPADARAILTIDNVLAVAIGDLDNDGQNEIALLYLQDGVTSWISILRYTNDGRGTRSLQEVKAVSQGPTNEAGSTAFAGTVDLVAADLDGMGRDELFVQRSVWDVVPIGTAFNLGLRLAVMQSDSAFGLTVGPTTAIDRLGFGLQSSFQDPKYYPRAQLAAGLFQFDPSQDFNLSRRQIAAVWNPGGGDSLFVAALNVSADLGILPIGGVDGVYELKTGNRGSPFHNFSVAAGGFVGNANAQDPRWALAVSAWMVGCGDG